MMKGARMLEGVDSRGGMIPWLCNIPSFSFNSGVPEISHG